MAAYTVMWEYKTVTKLLLLQALVKREKSVWLICYFGLMYKRCCRTEAARELLTSGKRHLLVSDIPLAVTTLGDACEQLSTVRI